MQKGIDKMKIYYFSKDIQRRKGHCQYGNGQLEEYTSKEELIREFEKTLDNNCETPLTKQELTSIVCEDMPNYDFFTIQYMIDGFGHDTATATALKTYEECVAWIADPSNKYEGGSYKIVGQFWGKEYWEYFD